MQLLKDILVPIITFVIGSVSSFFVPSVKQSLTDYRTTLTEISHTIIRNVILMHTKFELPPVTADDGKTNQRLRDLSDKLRDLHARLLSSATSFPSPSRVPLRVLGLIRSPRQIKEGATMLIGISNQIVSRDKNLPHLIELIKRLGKALDINVGE